MDTRNKRASVLGRALPFLMVAPLPDGNIGQADRLHLAWLYVGTVHIVVVPAERILVIAFQDRSLTIAFQNRSLTIRGS